MERTGGGEDERESAGEGLKMVGEVVVVVMVVGEDRMGVCGWGISTGNISSWSCL
jgi:hypothetical protein